MLGPSLACFALAFAVSWLLTAGLIRWAPRMGLIDQPDPRKVHTQPTPRAGGLAIFAALLLTTAVFAAFNLQSSIGILGWLLAAVIVALGLADDIRPLPWQVRLAAQAVVAVVAVAWVLPPASWPVRAATVFWVLSLVNAFNMLDNMDALSAGVAWVAAGCLALAPQPVWAPDGSPWLAYLAFMGALTGFLWFNHPPARIFMGDAGSTFLGFFLALASLRLVFGETAAEDATQRPWTLAAPVLILAVPWYDLTTVVALRLAQGRSPFHADKQHLSHRLVALGLGPPAAVRVIYLLALASGAAGLVLYHLPDAVGAGLLGVAFVSLWAAVAGVEYFRRR